MAGNHVPFIGRARGIGHGSVEVVVPGNGADGEGGRGNGGHVEAAGGGFAGTSGGGSSSLEREKENTLAGH